MAMAHPDFSLEDEAARAGLAPVCGIDEAGRGPWAGPVVAAAVILDPQAIPAGISDSKTLDMERREKLFASISASADVGIGVAPAGSRAAINRSLVRNTSEYAPRTCWRAWSRGAARA